MTEQERKAIVARPPLRLEGSAQEAEAFYRGWSRTHSYWRALMRPHPRLLASLRRTCATGMAEIGVAPHIVEACLNHVSGARAGVAGVYNRAIYAEEKRAALERWAGHVAGLVPP
jgi:hypothetical protein